MTDKLKLVLADQLRMDEVPIVERMSGYSLVELMDLDGGAIPLSVIMALAYVTERRVRPALQKHQYQQMSTTEFMAYFDGRFEAETVPEDYADWTVETLKAELGRRSLPTHGRKQALIDRLREDDGTQEDPTEAA